MPVFAPMHLLPDPFAPPPTSEPEPCHDGIIEIMLGGGRAVRVDRHANAEALRRVLGVLEEGRLSRADMAATASGWAKTRIPLANGPAFMEIWRSLMGMLELKPMPTMRRNCALVVAVAGLLSF